MCSISRIHNAIIFKGLRWLNNFLFFLPSRVIDPSLLLFSFLPVWCAVTCCCRWRMALIALRVQPGGVPRYLRAEGPLFLFLWKKKGRCFSAHQEVELHMGGAAARTLTNDDVDEWRQVGEKSLRRCRGELVYVDDVSSFATMQYGIEISAELFIFCPFYGAYFIFIRGIKEYNHFWFLKIENYGLSTIDNLNHIVQKHIMCKQYFYNAILKMVRVQQTMMHSRSLLSIQQSERAHRKRDRKLTQAKILWHFNAFSNLL